MRRGLSWLISRSRLWWLRVVITVFATALAASALIALDFFLLTRPTATEVATYYAQRQPVRIDPSLSVLALTSEAILRIEPLDNWQVVLKRYELGTERPCLSLELITKRRLTGMHVQGTSSRCFSPAVATDAIQLVSFQRNQYVVQAGIVTDPSIANLQLSWIDGTRSTLSVQDTFFITRDDGIGLVSAVGLDTKGTIVEGSLVHSRSLQLETALASRREVIGWGLVEVGVYDQPALNGQRCLRLSFLTRQGLTSSITGENYLSEQVLCGELPAWQGGLFGSAVLDKTVVVAGHSPSAAAASVVVLWADGETQVAPVIDGIFIVQRDGHALEVQAVSWLGQ